MKTPKEQQIYLLKNMGTLDKNSEAYKSKEYPQLFDVSEIGKMVHEDTVAYSQSYARMKEMETEVSYNAQISYEEGEAKGMAKGIAKGRAEGIAEGRAEGRAEGIAEIIRNLALNGISIDRISELTGFAQKEIRNILNP